MSNYIDQYTKSGTIPLDPVPSQEFEIELSGGAYTLNIYQRDATVYADLKDESGYVFSGVKALDRTGLKLSGYMRLPGQLWFEDQAGEEDPDYSGFGTRFLLCYGVKE